MAANHNVPQHLVKAVHETVFHVNPYINGIYSLSNNAIQMNASIHLNSMCSHGEIAAIHCLDNTMSISPHEICIHVKSDNLLEFINSMNPLYKTLQYVLLFPDGK